MNRKLIAGAAAALLIPASLGVVSAGAKKASPPTITSIALSSQSPSVSFSETSSQIAPYQTATLTITGTNLAGIPASKIKATETGGLIALKGKPFTVKSITSSSAATLVATVQGPTGNSLIQNMSTGDAPGTISLTVSKVAAPTTISVVSNCGPALPTAADPGVTYSSTGGVLDTPLNPIGTSPGLTYFDVSTLGYALCADDIGSATTAPPPSFAANYPVQFSSTSATANSINGIAFAFPYNTDRTLLVSSTSITYHLNNVVSGGASCSIPTTGQPAGINYKKVKCTVVGKTLTVTDTKDKLTFNKGDTIHGPVVNLTGITKTDSGQPASITPTGDTSGISISGLKVSIVFSPRSGSGSATYAALSTSS